MPTTRGPMRLRRMGPVLLAAALAASACGSRSSRDEIRAAYNEGRGLMASSSPTTAAPPEAVATDEVLPAADGPAAAPQAPAVGNAASGPRPGMAASRAAPAGKAGAGEALPAPARGAPGPESAPAAGAAPAGETGVGGSSVGGCTGKETPIVVGSVGNYSGIGGSVLNMGLKAVQAWAATENAAGGLACHNVKYVIADDGSDPARNLALVRQLVEREGVVAFVFFAAPLSGQGSKQYLVDNKIPVIGQEGGSPFYDDSPVHFPQVPSGNGMSDLVVLSAAHEFIPQGLKKLAMFTCTEADICRLADDRWPVAIAKVGFELVSRQKITITQPDYTSQCLSMQSAKAEIVIGYMDPNSWKRLSRSCEQVGFTPKYGLTSIHASADMPRISAFDGASIAQGTVSWMAELPAVKRYRRALQQYAMVPPDSTTITAWAAAELFGKAVKALPATEALTAVDLLRGMYSIRNETLDGLTGSLTYIEGKPLIQPSCGWTVVFRGGKVTSDDKVVCMSDYR